MHARSGGGGDSVYRHKGAALFRCGALPRSVKVYGWSEVAFVQAEHNIIAAIVAVSYFCNCKDM